MGMTASQARFLCLTARKSNVEFEGQQINQQRTCLSNQSASYYSELCNMVVPIPPSIEDYTRVSYTFDDGALSNTITSMIARTEPEMQGYYSVSYMQQWQDDYAIVPASSSLIEMSPKATSTAANPQFDYKIGTTKLRTLSSFATPINGGTKEVTEVIPAHDATYDWNGYLTKKELTFNGNKVSITGGSNEIPTFKYTPDNTPVGPKDDTENYQLFAEKGSDLYNKINETIQMVFTNSENEPYAFMDRNDDGTFGEGHYEAEYDKIPENAYLTYEDRDYVPTSQDDYGAYHILSLDDDGYYEYIGSSSTSQTQSTPQPVIINNLNDDEAQNWISDVVSEMKNYKDMFGKNPYYTPAEGEKTVVKTIPLEGTWDINWDVVNNDDYLKTLDEKQLTQLAEQELYYQKLLNEAYVNNPAATDQWYVKYTQNTTTGAWVPSFYKQTEVEDQGKYVDGYSSGKINCFSIGSTTKTQEVLNKLARVEKDSSGRYVSLTIYHDKGNMDNYVTYQLITNTSTDEDAYNDAMNQYNYDQSMYDKKIQDINSKLKIVQQQDKALELNLKALDTEENAINTEMESVKKVLQKNIESSFKTFNA